MEFESASGKEAAKERKRMHREKERKFQLMIAQRHVNMKMTIGVARVGDSE